MDRRSYDPQSLELTGAHATVTLDRQTTRGGRDVDPLLFIVSREQPDLHNYLTKEFSRDEQIRIILDRRQIDRRQRVEAPRDDHRQAIRRRPASVQEQMKSVGFAVVRANEGIPS